MGTEAAKYLVRFYHTLKMAQGHVDIGKWIKDLVGTKCQHFRFY